MPPLPHLDAPCGDLETIPIQRVATPVEPASAPPAADRRGLVVLWLLGLVIMTVGSMCMAIGETWAVAAAIGPALAIIAGALAWATVRSMRRV